MMKFFEKNPLFSWAITIIGAIMIFYISGISFPPSKPGIGIYSIIYHFSAFFLFSFFLLMSVLKGKNNNLLFIFAILFAIAYSITDEIHQFFVAGRYCTYYDVFVNATGILFASVIYLVRIKK